MATLTVRAAGGAHALSLRRGRCRVRVDRIDVDCGRRRPARTWQWQLSGPLDVAVAAQRLRRRPVRDAREHRRRRCTPAARAWSVTSAPARRARAPGLRRVPGRGRRAARGLAGRALARHPPRSTCSARSSSAGSTSARARASTASRPTTSTATPTQRLPAARRRPAALQPLPGARGARARARRSGSRTTSTRLRRSSRDFDWALNEQCFQYRECDRLRPFTAAGKAVFVVEYELAPDAFCPAARAAGLHGDAEARSSWTREREPCW